MNQMKHLFEKGMRESHSQPRVEFLNNDLPYVNRINVKELNTSVAALQNTTSVPIMRVADGQGAVDVKTLTSKHFKPKSKKLKHSGKHAN